MSVTQDTTPHQRAGGQPGEQPSARTRLIDAMAAALAEADYAEVTVADVVRHARTSRRTFYEHFADKQECLEALLGESAQSTAAEIAAAVDPTSPWDQQIRDALTAWLRASKRDKAITLNWIRVLPGLGGAGRDVVRASMRAYSEMVHALAETPELAAAGITPPPQPVITMLLGGLRELIATTVEAGDDVESIAEVAIDTAIRMLAPQP